MKVHIATSRYDEIGKDCIEWAFENMPKKWEYSKNPSDCDVFISILYERLISEEYVATHRCYNFHPGILPAYRGSGAYSWVLINREQETGITLHKMSRNIDDGAIIAIRRTTINKTDTAESLFYRCMDILLRSFKASFQDLLLENYEVWDKMSGGHLYLKKDLQEARDITHILKAFTFEEKGPAYWVDSKNNKRFLRWE